MTYQQLLDERKILLPFTRVECFSNIKFQWNGFWSVICGHSNPLLLHPTKTPVFSEPVIVTDTKLNIFKYFGLEKKIDWRAYKEFHDGTSTKTYYTSNHKTILNKIPTFNHYTNHVNDLD